MFAFTVLANYLQGFIFTCFPLFRTVIWTVPKYGLIVLSKMYIKLFKSSKNVLLLENDYKVLYRWYYTSARLARLISSYSPLCFRGCSQESTMAHIWWSCPKVCRPWVRVYVLLRNIFYTNIKRHPYEALLYKPIVELLHPERKLALHLFTATKLTIVRTWLGKPLYLALKRLRIV